MTGETARSVVGEATADALAALPEHEWQLLHHVGWPGRPQATLDHVAVGPQGVFVIDTVSSSGGVEVSGGVVREDGRRRTKYVDGATNATMAVSGLLPGFAPETVLPVLCFVRPDPVFGWAGDVMVCSTENLVRMMTARPQLLDEREVLRAAEMLRTSLHPTTLPLVVVRRPAPERPVPVRPRRKRRRISGEALVGRFLVVGVLAVLVVTLMRLDVLPPFGELRERGAETISEIRHPTTPVGETATLKQTPTRPALDVTVGAPVLTRSTTPSVRALPGNVLLAVPLTIRNGGGITWASFPDTTVMLRDQAGGSYRANPTVTRVASGRVLPAAIKLRPGRSTRGLMVFEVPRGTKVATVQLESGPGKPDVLRWKVD